METKTCTRLPETMLTEILARLPLTSISRFKSVSKTWKSTLESLYFRSLFVSVHKNTCSSWSLFLGRKEIIDSGGCKTWGLPKSLASYIPNSECVYHAASSNGLVLIKGLLPDCTFVGNPVLQEWFEIPAAPSPFYNSVRIGLVTRVNEDGVVLSFKVVKVATLGHGRHDDSTCLCTCVYSSETAIWTPKELHSPHYFTHISPSVSLNGTLYLSLGVDSLTESKAILAHDFYSESNLCRFIPLPDHNMDFKSALTTSSGFVMYIKTLPHNVLKVWRLLSNDDDDNDSANWKLEWEIRLPFDDISYYAPLAMHPFDRNILYLWSQQNRCLVSCNLHTQNYNFFEEDQSKRCINDDDLQNCFLNHYTIKGYGIPVTVTQIVLPRWMESMPRPTKLWKMNTTSLLLYIPAKQKTRRN